MRPKPARTPPGAVADRPYGAILGDISGVSAAARSAAARSMNFVMTAADRLIGRRIVESEQKGKVRAEYGEELIARLAADLPSASAEGFPCATCGK